MTKPSIRLLLAGMAGLILQANAQNLINNPGFETTLHEPVREADLDGNVAIVVILTMFSASPIEHLLHPML